MTVMWAEKCVVRNYILWNEENIDMQWSDMCLVCSAIYEWLLFYYSEEKLTEKWKWGKCNGYIPTIYMCVYEVKECSEILVCLTLYCLCMPSLCTAFCMCLETHSVGGEADSGKLPPSVLLWGGRGHWGVPLYALWEEVEMEADACMCWAGDVMATMGFWPSVAYVQPVPHLLWVLPSPSCLPATLDAWGGCWHLPMPWKESDCLWLMQWVRGVTDVGRSTVSDVYPSAWWWLPLVSVWCQAADAWCACMLWLWRSVCCNLPLCCVW